MTGILQQDQLKLAGDVIRIVHMLGICNAFIYRVNMHLNFSDLKLFFLFVYKWEWIVAFRLLFNIL